MFSSFEEHQNKVSRECQKKLEEKEIERRYKAEIRALRGKRDELRSLLAAKSQKLTANSQMELKLNELRWIQKLLGCRINVVTPESVDLEFSTSHSGRFYESYRVSLQMRGDNFAVRDSSNIPSFVLLKKCEEFLKSNVSHFVHYLHSYLNAFVCRRQDIEISQAILRPYLNGNISSVSPYSFSSFTCQVTEDSEHSGEIMFVIQYNNLTSSIPSLSDLRFTGNFGEEFVTRVENHWSSVVTRQALPESLESLVIEVLQDEAQNSSCFQESLPVVNC